MGNSTNRENAAHPPLGTKRLNHGIQTRLRHGNPYNMKVVVRGDRETGKSVLLRRLEGHAFEEEHMTTPQIQVINILWTYKATEDVVKVEVWDVVDKGKLRPRRSRTPSDTPSPASPHGPGHVPGAVAGHNALVADAQSVDVYKGAQAAIVMIDPQRKWTLEYAQKCIEDIPDNLDTLVMCSFADMAHRRQLSIDDMEQWLRKQPEHVSYLECSLKDCYGLKELHTWLNIPFLKMKRRSLESLVQQTRGDLDSAKLELQLLSESMDYDTYLKKLQETRPNPQFKSKPKTTKQKQKVVAQAKRTAKSVGKPLKKKPKPMDEEDSVDEDENDINTFKAPTIEKGFFGDDESSLSEELSDGELSGLEDEGQKPKVLVTPGQDAESDLEMSEDEFDAPSHSRRSSSNRRTSSSKRHTSSSKRHTSSSKRHTSSSSRANLKPKKIQSKSQKLIPKQTASPRTPTSTHSTTKAESDSQLQSSSLQADKTQQVTKTSELKINILKPSQSAGKEKVSEALEGEKEASTKKTEFKEEIPESPASLSYDGADESGLSSGVGSPSIDKSASVEDSDDSQSLSDDHVPRAQKLMTHVSDIPEESYDESDEELPSPLVQPKLAAPSSDVELSGSDEDLPEIPNTPKQIAPELPTTPKPETPQKRDGGQEEKNEEPTDTQPDMGSGLESDAGLGTEPGTEPDAEPGAKADAGSDVEPDTRGAGVDPGTGSDAEPDSEPTVQPKDDEPKPDDSVDKSEATQEIDKYDDNDSDLDSHDEPHDHSLKQTSTDKPMTEPGHGSEHDSENELEHESERKTVVHESDEDVQLTDEDSENDLPTLLGPTTAKSSTRRGHRSEDEEDGDDLPVLLTRSPKQSLEPEIDDEILQPTKKGDAYGMDIEALFTSEDGPKNAPLKPLPGLDLFFEKAHTGTKNPSKKDKKKKKKKHRSEESSSSHKSSKHRKERHKDKADKKERKEKKDKERKHRRHKDKKKEKEKQQVDDKQKPKARRRTSDGLIY